MAEHNEKGKIGEQLAEEYLINHGYEVLYTNWYAGSYEVDIIAKKNNLLVFCEVKYRSSNFFGEPELFVNKRKQRNILKAAEIYIEKFQWQGENQFDIISILKNNNIHTINHIESAFSSSWRY